MPTATGQRTHVQTHVLLKDTSAEQLLDAEGAVYRRGAAWAFSRDMAEPALYFHFSFFIIKTAKSISMF